MSNSDRRNSSRQSQEIDENLYYEEEQEYTLPHNGLTRAILIGLAGGVVALVISIGIVVSHASLFNDAALAASKNGSGMSYQMAISIVTWQGISAIIDLIIAFAVGMIAGKIVVKRGHSFAAGMTVGAIIYIGILFAQFIPGYPGVIRTASTTGISPQGFLAFVIFAIFTLIYMLVGGLLSLWGARIMTRKHPYYLSRRQQKAQLKE